MFLENEKPPSEQSARERILQTAHDLFYGEGIRATGIDRIIEKAKVTKVTFYRHFPSKNSLIAAYLERRHQSWMAWFSAALGRTPRGGFVFEPLISALRDWFQDAEFRGCAFINGVAESDGMGPWVAEIALAHKKSMTETIALLQPDHDQAAAEAAAMAVDGAITRVQMEKRPEAALATLEVLLRGLGQSPSSEVDV
jgi:AcrR family transcriptional regulator